LLSEDGGGLAIRCGRSVEVSVKGCSFSNCKCGCLAEPTEEERGRFRGQSEKEGVLQDKIVYDALVNILRTISSNVSNSWVFSQR
jgi:hypothetical protein